MVAEATATVVVHLRDQKWDMARAREYSGTYHLSAAGQTSWAEFAAAILSEYAGRPEAEQFKVRKIIPITTAEYPLPARRPANSLLSNQKITQAFGIVMPSWRDQLRLVLGL